MSDPASEPVDAEIVEEPAALPAVPGGRPAAPVLASDYDERGVPSFDYVRDKIERTSAIALGTTELVQESAAGRTLDEQLAARDKAAKAKLDEIRKSLGL